MNGGSRDAQIGRGENQNTILIVSQPCFHRCIENSLDEQDGGGRCMLPAPLETTVLDNVLYVVLYNTRAWVYSVSEATVCVLIHQATCKERDAHSPPKLFVWRRAKRVFVRHLPYKYKSIGSSSAKPRSVLAQLQEQAVTPFL